MFLSFYVNAPGKKDNYKYIRRVESFVETGKMISLPRFTTEHEYDSVTNVYITMLVFKMPNQSDVVGIAAHSAMGMEVFIPYVNPSKAFVEAKTRVISAVSERLQAASVSDYKFPEKFNNSNLWCVWYLQQRMKSNFATIQNKLVTPADDHVHEIVRAYATFISDCIQQSNNELYTEYFSESAVTPILNSIGDDLSTGLLEVFEKCKTVSGKWLAWANKYAPVKSTADPKIWRGLVPASNTKPTFCF